MQTKLPISFNETIEFLNSYNAIEKGHFILASGNHSEYYIKKGNLIQYPWEVQKMIEQKLDDIKKLGDISLILSPAMGGVPVGQQVGIATHTRTIYAERNTENNQLEFKRGFEIYKNDKLLLVEDVITTGGTLVELMDFIKLKGAYVAGIFVIVNRSGKKTLNSIPIVSCMEIEFDVYSKDEIPDNLKKIKAIRPGTKIIV